MGPTGTATADTTDISIAVPQLSAAEVAELSTEDLKALLAASTRAMASVAGLICLLGGELERRQGYRDEGATSLASWLVERTGVSAASARALAEVGERLVDLPHLAGALVGGEVSFDAVRTVAGVATPKSDAALAAAAKEHSVRELAELARATKRPGPSAEAERRSLRCNDACRTIVAQLPQEAYAEAKALLETRAKRIGSEGTTPWDQRMADALVAALRGGGANRAPGSFAVVAHVPLAALIDESDESSQLCAELDAGGLISTEVVRRLACESTVIIAVDDDVGHTMYEGRQRRDPTDAQRREIGRRDRHCRFPSCTNVTFTNAHHLKHWQRDFGPTDLDNLALLCEYHHALVHSKGWELSGDANAELTFVGPSGRVMTSRPSPRWTRVSDPAWSGD